MAMVDKAKQQLAALLFNLVSEKIGQYTIVTSDNRTVSDVMTYVSNLIIDGVDTNDELAKDLAEDVNEQTIISNGVVPSSNVLYKISGQQKVEMTYNYSLNQNYRNPFNPITKINYSVPEKTQVDVVVYDMLGNKIITLVNKIQESGNYSVNFKVDNFPSGVYFYRLQTPSFISTKKMIILK